MVPWLQGEKLATTLVTAKLKKNYIGKREEKSNII